MVSTSQLSVVCERAMGFQTGDKVGSLKEDIGQSQLERDIGAWRKGRDWLKATQQFSPHPRPSLAKCLVYGQLLLYSFFHVASTIFVISSDSQCLP